MSKVVNLADIRAAKALAKQLVLAKLRELAAQVPAEFSDEERADYLDEIAITVAQVENS